MRTFLLFIVVSGVCCEVGAGHFAESTDAGDATRIAESALAQAAPDALTRLQMPGHPRSAAALPPATLSSPMAPLPEIRVVAEQQGEGGSRWAGDILVADNILETEGYVDMASSASGRFYAAVEYVAPLGYCVGIFRSDDGGAHWAAFAWICGAGQRVWGASVAAAEVTEDCLYVAYLYAGNCIVSRILLSDASFASTVVGPDDGMRGTPRITTDDIYYADYYLYLVHNGSLFTRSTDKGLTWSAGTELHPGASTTVTPDVAFGNQQLYATWWYELPAKTAGRSLPYGIAARKSTDWGATWQAVQYVVEDGENPRIEAIEHDNQVMIVYAKNNPWDNDIRCAYSVDAGGTWTADACVGCTSGVEERYPDIAVDGYLGNFRVAYWRAGNDIIYQQAPYSNPEGFSVQRTINDTHQATNAYAPPAVSSDYARNQGGIIWNDARTPTRAVYFDSEGSHRYILNVDGTGALPTIQAAIDVAVSGDTLELQNGIYTGTGNRDLDTMGKGIVILSSSGDPTQCIIDCQGSASSNHRGFFIHSGEGMATRIQGITIRNGYVAASGGGIYCVGASPSIFFCNFENNTAYDGGGLYNISGDTYVMGCQFRNNAAGDAGGAIMNHTCSPHINYTTFTDNSAVWGGGALYQHHASALVGHCEFKRNTSANWGGAIHSNYSESVVSASYCTLLENAAPYGGAVYDRGGARFDSETSTFYANAATAAGGAIYNTGAGSSSSLGTTILSFSSAGAAVSCASGGTATLSCCDVYGNAGGDWIGCIAGQDVLRGNMCLDPLFCNTSSGNFTLMDDSPCLPDNNSCGLYIGAWREGCPASDVPATVAPPSPRGLSSFPNPFREATRITFELPQGARAELAIYDAGGRLVRTLLSEESASAPGPYRVLWDGRDQEGRPVSSGIYLCSLHSAAIAQVARVLVIR